MAIELSYFSHLPPQKESNTQQPCLWFDDLIKINEPYRFKDNFLKIANEHHKLYGGDTDFSELSFTYNSTYEIEGKKDKFTMTYFDFFNGIVKFQISKSKDLISEKIESCQTQEHAKIVLQNIINRLQFLLAQLKKRRKLPIREFPSIPLGLYELIRYLHEAHGPFLPDPLPAIFTEAQNPIIEQFSNLYNPPEDDIKSNTAINSTEDVSVEKDDLPAPITDEVKSENNEIPPMSDQDALSSANYLLINEIKSFSWIGNPEILSFHLYEILVKQNVINKVETDFSLFCHAFNGELLEQELRIKWHLKSTHKSIKAPIIRMFYQLINELGLINKIDSDGKFARMIERIFVDENGNKLKAVHSSKIEVGKSRSIEENELYESLNGLKSLIQ